jgi:hypothetical protein
VRLGFKVELWFNIKLSITDSAGFYISGATITGTWDGAPIGTVDDNGDGTYNCTIPAKFVPFGGNPLLLDLVASQFGYCGGELNLEISVESPEFSKKLIINIIESNYNEDTFDLKVEIRDYNGDLVIGTILAGVWNNVGLTTQNITNNGDGIFDLTLTPCFVPTENDPIWLNLTASKSRVQKLLIKNYSNGANKILRIIRFLNKLKLYLKFQRQL